MSQSPLKCVASVDMKSKKPKFSPSSTVKNHFRVLVGLGILTGVFAVLIALHGPSFTPNGWLKPADIVIPSVSVTLEDVQVQQGAPSLPLQEKSHSLVDSQSSGASTSKISELVEWMMSQGVVFSNSEIVTYDALNSHRGIHSTRAFEAGDIVFTIPAKVLVTSEIGRASSVGKLLRESLAVEADAHFVYLAFFLLEERALGKQSSWYPFIETLPVSFLNMPVNFGKEEVALMEGSVAKRMYEHELKLLHTTYNMLRERIPELTKKFSFEYYKWGHLSVLTRTFLLTVQGKTVYGMMPYADMFNHVLDNNIIWGYNDDMNAATFTATKPISQGAALSVSYGDKGNEALLVYYGFALRDNPHNEAAIYVGLTSTDPLIDRKIPLVRDSVENIYHQFFVLSASPDHPAFREALKLCRLAVATEDELQFFPNSGGHLPFSLKNERSALLHLASKADAALSQFPQTMENDEKLLKDDNLSFNHRNIILTRLGEKQVLQKIIEFVNLAVSLLQIEDEKAFKKARLQPQYREFRSYLREVAEVYRHRSSKKSI